MSAVTEEQLIEKIAGQIRETHAADKSGELFAKAMRKVGRERAGWDPLAHIGNEYKYLKYQAGETAIGKGLSKGWSGAKNGIATAGAIGLGLAAAAFILPKFLGGNKAPAMRSDADGINEAAREAVASQREVENTVDLSAMPDPAYTPTGTAPDGRPIYGEKSAIAAGAAPRTMLAPKTMMDPDQAPGPLSRGKLMEASEPSMSLQA